MVSGDLIVIHLDPMVLLSQSFDFEGKI